jgi:hypothetical protein
VLQEVKTTAAAAAKKIKASVQKGEGQGPATSSQVASFGGFNASLLSAFTTPRASRTIKDDTIEHSVFVVRTLMTKPITMSNMAAELNFGIITCPDEQGGLLSAVLAHCRRVCAIPDGSTEGGCLAAALSSSSELGDECVV